MDLCPCNWLTVASKLEVAAALRGNSLTAYVKVLFQEHETELERKG